MNRHFNQTRAIIGKHLSLFGENMHIAKPHVHDDKVHLYLCLYLFLLVCNQHCANKKTLYICPQSILGEFNREQSEFIKGQEGRGGSAAVAPWIGAHNEAALKEECLSLSVVSVAVLHS